ncbi:MAG TPA: hypothetical protein VM911_17695 [Pyrinomonadaceae bacterium]|jgi:hypothetical protein|nr:hypothetical protein [Pyrinomonadaceae bacterium]
MMTKAPGQDAFTPQEWKLIETLRTPRQVQHYLRTIPYNWGREGATQHSFRTALKRREAHCLEAALVAATILEQHGYPPLLLSLESKDQLDHVVFIFQQKGRWGGVARSRDIGLHGRKPVFRTVRDLVWSYFDPYVDLTGRITGYGATNLYELGNYDWRFSPRNRWHVENHLREIPHARLRASNKRYRRLLARYKEFRREHPQGSPTYFADRVTWML